MMIACMILHYDGVWEDHIHTSGSMPGFSYFTILMKYKSTYILRALKICGEKYPNVISK